MTATSTVLAERYRLVRPLGRGGMGTVWLARDETLARDVAVKEVVPPVGLAEDERKDLRRRTLREARAAARLSHPNVVRVYDIVDGPEWPWIVMEYVPARSLQQVIRDEGPMPPERVAAIGLPVLDALRAAHRAGVMHRDVKPGNVLLADDGRVVLTDFGLATVPDEATVTLPGLVLGSPSYISPERARGDAGGPASDLWSLGATLFAALEGHAPFERTSAIATLTALATEPPPPPRRGSGKVGRVIDGLLSKTPEHRMGAAEAERLLRSAGRGVPPLIRKPQDTEPVPPDPPPGQRDGHTLRAEPIPAAAEPPIAVADNPAKAETRVATSGSARPTAVAESPAEAETAPAADDLRSRLGGRVPTRRDTLVSRHWRLAVAVLVALISALAVLITVQPDGNQEPGPITQPTPPPTSAPAPTPSRQAAAPTSRAAPTGFALPAGWRFHRDPTGFVVAVPANWTVYRRGTIVYFDDPDGGRLLGVDQTDRPKSNPVADWETQEDARVAGGDFPAYERIGIRRCTYFVTCADWEFRYTKDGVRTHANNRGVVTTASKRAYGFWWSTPDSQWTASLPLLQNIFASFQPEKV